MIKYLLVILISTLFLVALTHFTPSSSLKTEIHTAQVLTNPIDRIHGDKWLENNTIRTNNFDSILAIPAFHLKSPSELYLIQSLPNQYFLLTRKKFFHQNRRYSLIVKVEDNRIVQVSPFFDLDIRKLIVYNNKYYVLQGDYSELDNHWGYDYIIKLTCFNNKFESIWSIQTPTRTGYYFIPEDLSIENNELQMRFGLQGSGSSTMCVLNYQTFFKLNGEYKTTNSLGGYQCGPEPDINEVFFQKAFRLN